jgi:hypothetical protein
MGDVPGWGLSSAIARLTTPIHRSLHRDLSAPARTTTDFAVGGSPARSDGVGGSSHPSALRRAWRSRITANGKSRSWGLRGVRRHRSFRVRRRARHASSQCTAWSDPITLGSTRPAGRTMSWSTKASPGLDPTGVGEPGPGSGLTSRVLLARCSDKRPAGAVVTLGQLRRRPGWARARVGPLRRRGRPRRRAFQSR